MKNQSLCRSAFWLIVLLGWCAQAMPVDFDAGLIAYFPFEGRDDIIRDASGSELDGNIQTAVRENSGKFGRGVRFPDKDAQARIPASPILTVQKDFTAATWVFPTKLDFAGENRVIFTDQYNHDLLRGGGRLDLFSGGRWQGTRTGPELEVETWNHVAGTFESKKQTGAYYVNGKLIGQVATDKETLDPSVSPLRLGFCCGLAGFVGILDEVRIYDRSLDDKEIAALFEFDPGAFSVSPGDSLATVWGTVKISR